MCPTVAQASSNKFVLQIVGLSPLRLFSIVPRYLTFILLMYGYSVATNAEPTAPACIDTVGEFASIEGTVEVQHTDHAEWLQAKLGSKLCENDSIRVGKHSRAAVSLINEAVLRLKQNTTIRLTDITEKEEDSSVLDIIMGVIQSFSRQPHKFAVNTPYLNGSIEGTEFLVEVGADSSTLTVLEGKVTAANEHGSVQVTAGNLAHAQAGVAPVLRTLVNPKDAVQWSFYYPPVLALSSSSGQGSAAAQNTQLDSALQTWSAGNSPEAFAILESIPEKHRNAEYYLYRASLLLSVGEVDAARQNIDRSLALDPGNGLAYAQRAIIAVVLNQRRQALKDAERAVELSNSSAAKIALSYAQQANFQIQDASNTLATAVAEHPDDALAWSRYAELQLMLGDRRGAKKSAEKATVLNPGLARTQLVLGYTALAEFKNKTAISAFKAAIRLESADPLAHLGLGLAKISSGDLKQGRSDIEVAVSLDANNSLLRSYLGKAYFEEKRYPLDSQQYEIAKSLDPLDPTPYLYDGILKQTINRPVEAVKDFEKSIELNENRSVYRSRLLLDKDRAARGTSLARAYRDLEFNQLGVNESTQSLGYDPANASAHRFLSDSYRGMRRRETSRISELLQSQLLQDININPVQPSISSTNLNIITQGGPASPGFDEFTPLFEQNMARLDATGVVGNNNTYGGEGVVSGIYDRLSLSGGAFYYDTNGFRPNNDLKHEIYNAFGQIAIMPELNLQAEFQHRRTTHGDLAQNFDPDDFSENLHRTFKGDMARFGARITPAEHSNILVSFVYTDREDSQNDKVLVQTIPGVGDVNAVTELDLNDKTYQIESQYIFQHERVNFLVGGGYADIEKNTNIDLTFETPDGDFSPPIDPLDDDNYDARAYFYGNVNFPTPVTWTLGLGYARYQQAFDNEEERLLPKVGVEWNILKSLRLRGTYFETVKPVLAANRTIEPTQVAGFNQFFDDADGTYAKRYGWALDWVALDSLYLGAEMSWRDIEWQVTDLTNEAIVEEDRNEWHHRLYAYWTPTDRWAFSLEGVFDNFSHQQNTLLADSIPLESQTISVPIKALYFHPNGLFGTLGVTYVNQDVKRAPQARFEQGVSNFATVDLALGYRLPKRYGIISLGIQNLFNNKFYFQDDSYREFGDEPSIGPYIPERTILGKISLSF